jgi:hypothetical protein
MYGFQIKAIVMKVVMKLGRRLEEYYGITVKESLDKIILISILINIDRLTK